MRALALTLILLAAGCAASSRPDNASGGAPSSGSEASSGAPAQQATPQVGDPAPPPAVLSGEGRLDCSISNRENGHQKLALSSGQGLEFDVVVSPIVDGVVQTKGPDQGGSYRFSSHLASEGTGTLSGVGAVVIDALETRVNVEMKRYQQPKGPGTELSFSSENMAERGIYVEFAGRARGANGDRYAFRVTLAQPGPGSGGKVTPASNADNAGIMAKVVVITAPVTTVVTSAITTSVQKLP